MDKVQLIKSPDILFLLDEHLTEPNVLSYKSDIETIKEVKKKFLAIFIPDKLKSKIGKEKLTEIEKGMK